MSYFLLNLHPDYFTMTNVKKSKKAKKAKKGGSKPKKNNKKNSLNLFSKIVLILLLIVVFATAIYMTITVIKSNNKGKQTHKELVTINKEIKTEEEKTINKKVKIKEEKAGTEDKKAEIKDEKVKNEDKKSIANSIEGNWLSMVQGVALTMKGKEYRIDFMGIDASKPITGTYKVEDKNIIFTNSEGVCKDEEGIYKVTFNKKNIHLTCKSDNCTKRKNVLEAEWEWIEE